MKTGDFTRVRFLFAFLRVDECNRDFSSTTPVGTSEVDSPNSPRVVTSPVASPKQQGPPLCGLPQPHLDIVRSRMRILGLKAQEVAAFKMIGKGDHVLLKSLARSKQFMFLAGH